MQSVWIAQNQSYGELYVFLSEDKLFDFLKQEAEERDQNVFYDLGRYFISKFKDDDDPVIFADEYYEHGTQP